MYLRSVPVTANGLSEWTNNYTGSPAIIHSGSLNYQSCCITCGKNNGLLRCGGCKMVQYCGSAHQKADWKHKHACKGVKTARLYRDQEEEAVRQKPPSDFHPRNVFQEGRGSFFSEYPETRPYIRSLFAYAVALLRVPSYDAVRAALSAFLDILMLNSVDNLGARYLIPFLYLRLGQIQECWQFLKGCGPDENGVMPSSFLHLSEEGHIFNPVLGEEEENIFSSVPEAALHNSYPLAHRVAFFFVKMKLLLELYSARDCQLLIKRLPQELVDLVRDTYVNSSSLICQMPGLLESSSKLNEYLHSVDKETKKIFDAVAQFNTRFWTTLFAPNAAFEKRYSTWHDGSLEEATLVTQWAFASYAEDPRLHGFVRRRGLMEMIALKARVAGEVPPKATKEALAHLERMVRQGRPDETGVQSVCNCGDPNCSDTSVSNATPSPMTGRKVFRMNLKEVRNLREEDLM